MNSQTSVQDMDFEQGLPQEQEQKKQAPARILEYASGRRIALPLHTTLEIVEDPEIVPVPGSAPHALGLLYWQERWVAVIDLGRLMQDSDADAAPAGLEKPKYVLVLAYQRAPGLALEYGAVTLPVLPETIFIDNDAICSLPEDSPYWPQISLSCFTYKDGATPIVDTGRLFGRSYG